MSTGSRREPAASHMTTVLPLTHVSVSADSRDAVATHVGVHGDDTSKLNTTSSEPATNETSLSLKDTSALDSSVNLADGDVSADGCVSEPSAADNTGHLANGDVSVTPAADRTVHLADAHVSMPSAMDNTVPLADSHVSESSAADNTVHLADVHLVNGNVSEPSATDSNVHLANGHVSEPSVLLAKDVGEISQSGSAVVSASCDQPAASQMNASTAQLVKCDDDSSDPNDTCTCGADSDKPGCYMRFIAHYPYIPIIVLLVVIGGMVGASYQWHPLPDFSGDPTKGFETRGTPIVSGVRTAATLEQHFRHPHNATTHYFLFPNTTRLQVSLGGTQLPSDPVRRRRRAAAWCNTREIEISSMKLVLEPTGSGAASDLFTAAALRDMCAFSERLVQPFLRSPCPVKSVAYYVAALRRKRCSQLDDADVAAARHLLHRCEGYYRSGALRQWSRTPQAAALGYPSECTDASFVFNALHYLTDSGFTAESDFRLSYALLYYEARGSLDEEKRFYEERLAGREVALGAVRLAGVQLRFHNLIKDKLFAQFVLSDLRYFGVAMAMMCVLMYVYLRSVVLLVATVLNVQLSFALAYFLYTFVFRFTFFPFINLLADLLLIAVGADDVFIFHDAWRRARDASCPRHGRADALRRAYAHAGVSIAVTSLTTASAFFVNFASSITAVRCFSVFAGLTMLTNLLVMLTWTPAVIAALDAVTTRCDAYACVARVAGACDALMSRPRRAVRWAFDTAIPAILRRAPALSIALFAAGVAGAAVAVFYSPGLHLPSSSRFQVLRSSNLLEKWDQGLRRQFPAVVEADSNAQKKIHLYVVFGFVARDTGNWLEPVGGESRYHVTPGSGLERDPAFDPYSIATQRWLLKFCEALKSQPFVVLYGVQPCGPVAYARALADICPYANTTQSPLVECCLSRTPPFDPALLRRCTPLLQYYIVRYPLTPNKHPEPVVGMPIFAADNAVRGYIFSLKSNFSYSLSYGEMSAHYAVLHRFMSAQLSLAPPGLRSGFLTAGGGGFLFYDLQEALARGTYTSVGLSLAVAFLMMLVTTLNPVIAVLAILTIACVILFTVAAIVLLGWSLNIVESVIISLAVGLSIDFTIHYGVAYRLSGARTAAGRVGESLGRVGVAVLTAALTTFVSGAAMLPCSILVYQQLGVFLMLVMTFSWLLATFLFQPLCLVAAPHRCQLRWPRGAASEYSVSDASDGRRASDYSVGDASGVSPRAASTRWQKSDPLEIKVSPTRQTSDPLEITVSPTWQT